MSKKFIVTLKKSLISCSTSQKEAARCLGLRKIRQSSEIADNPANRGQILKIQHLVDVAVKR